jgi:glycosyltransferase involved in cell wall biosynthesis
MVKLIIQIPCYNEAESLPQTLAGMPAHIPGVSHIETLIIDDGSNDDTAAVAQQLGVDHIIRHSHNRGLAAVFQTGLNECLRRGADIIVNTDGDNQYPGQEIPRLVAPILAGQADMVIGDRQTHTIAHFSPLKRFLQRWGSRVVRWASGTAVPDATSGFRAISRDAAMQLTIFTTYTYTLETIIQAGKKGLRIESVPIQVNPPLRQSRLIKSNWSFVKRNAATILRIYTYYEPLRTFTYISLVFLLPGLFLLARFMYFYLSDLSGVGRYVQSVVIGGTLTIVGVLIFILGVIADLIAANRLLSERILYSLKRLELNNSGDHRQKASD